MSWVLLNVILGLVCSIVFIANFSSQSRTSSTVLAWLAIIFFFPVVGVPLYFIFGGRKLKSLLKKKERLYSDHAVKAREHANGVEEILVHHYVPEATGHNKVNIIFSGEAAYKQLLSLIENARHAIEIQTYIIGNDSVGDAILKRLMEKAASGIKVRLLIDGLFAFVYPKRKIKALKRAGVEVSLFLPLRFRIFRSRVNLRNHRKLIIVDRKVAIMGGMNLAKNYMGPVKDAERWCDIALEIQGDSVKRLACLFRADWCFASGESTQQFDKTLCQGNTPNLPSAEFAPNWVQVVASGPDVEGDPFYNTLLFAIYAAKNTIYVVTPYFVPDVALVKALVLAAYRGVKVTIIVPRHSNHPIADFARSRHVRVLANAGVTILFFEPTMLHAKVVVIDDDLAIVGSANFDMRSLFFNFESCVYLYSSHEVENVSAWVKMVMARCSDKRYLANPGKLRLLLENIALLIAPLL